MMRVLSKGAALALSALVAGFTLSCSKDDTILYGDLSMVNIQNGVITSDEGMTFSVAERLCDDRYESASRVFFYSDILSKRDDGVFSIRLREYYPVLTKNILPREKAESATIGDDPISLITAWTSGDYLNMRLLVPYRASSSEKNIVNLVRETPSERGSQPSDTLLYTLHYREAPATGIVSASNYGYFYMSVPYKSQIPQGRKSVPFKISWEWNGISGYAPSQGKSGSVTGEFK